MSRGQGGGKKQKVVKKLLSRKVIDDSSRRQNPGSPVSVSTAASYFTDSNPTQILRQTAADPYYPVAIDGGGNQDVIFVDNVNRAMNIVASTHSGARGSSDP